jgi:hypothetical protein
VLQAFVMMDNSGTGEISLATFLEYFDVNKHPDVASGAKTAWKALRDIEDFFQACAVSQLPAYQLFDSSTRRLCV